MELPYIILVMPYKDKSKQKEHSKLYMREWRKIPKNHEKHNKRSRDRNRKNRMIVLNHYGLICNCCGESNIKFLTIDHDDNGGNKHRRLIGNSSTSLMLWLIKNNFPAGFSTMCYNCNLGRAKNGGICPHIVSTTL
jgi:hypothetical protein